MNKHESLYSTDVIDDPLYESLFNERERTELQRCRFPIYYFNVQNRDNHNSYSTDRRLKLYENDAIDYRYEILYRLGRGSFGTVYLSTDHKYKRDVAIKVICNETKIKKQAGREIERYDLMKRSKLYSPHVIRMLKVIRFRDDIFIVFENFGINMFEYYQQNTVLSCT